MPAPVPPRIASSTTLTDLKQLEEDSQQVNEGMQCLAMAELGQQAALKSKQTNETGAREDLTQLTN
ncbi:hypothetical protein FBU31_000291, partial [Coemansia sp. 'formosensis']